jgi:type IV pilus assembly protein PilM
MITSFFNTAITGIDIGTSSIKLASVSKRGESYNLENCDIIIFEKKCFNSVNGEITDMPYVQNCMHELISRQKSAVRNVVLSVPQKNIVKSDISLPADMSIDDQSYQIELEANRMLPPGYMARFDYYASNNDVNNSTSNANAANNGYTILSTPKDMVDSRLIVIENHKKIKPIIVDGDLSAAIRNTIYAWEQDNQKDQIRVLLHIGAAYSYMTVVYDGNIVYEQSLLASGNYLTQNIMQAYDMNFIDAEQKKISHDLPDSYKEDILNPYLENTLIDIIQGIQNFFSTSNLSRVDSIYLSGGCASLENLSKQIAKKTHTNTQVLNPFLGLVRSKNIDETSLRKHMPSYSVAIGLALRGLID